MATMTAVRFEHPLNPGALPDSPASAPLDGIAGEDEWPIFIGLLGDFRLLKHGRPITLRAGGKAEVLLSTLALRGEQSVSREGLLAALWPESDEALAGQSLSSLVYSLHRQLGREFGTPPPIVHTGHGYRLNLEAGVGVDVRHFEALVNAGMQQARTSDLAAAVASYGRAIELYRGDLCVGADAVVERERLRALFLNVLARLADYYYEQRDYASCLDYSLQLLAKDACREDAHRMVIRCYVHCGERAQALRQYHLCKDILRAEFDAAPEQATTLLYEQVRTDPTSV